MLHFSHMVALVVCVKKSSPGIIVAFIYWSHRLWHFNYFLGPHYVWVQSFSTTSIHMIKGILRINIIQNCSVWTLAVSAWWCKPYLTPFDLEHPRLERIRVSSKLQLDLQLLGGVHHEVKAPIHLGEGEARENLVRGWDSDPRQAVPARRQDSAPKDGDVFGVEGLAVGVPSKNKKASRIFIHKRNYIPDQPFFIKAAFTWANKVTEAFKFAYLFAK